MTSSRPGVEGPASAKIAIVGEAWGQKEHEAQAPFQGKSGQELNRMLIEAGINRAECRVTNVFCFRPAGNDLRTLTVKKKDLPKNAPEPFCYPLGKAGYLHPDYWDNLLALREEIQGANLILALGNTAIWACCGIKPAVSKMRGTFYPGPWGPKVLPTYHPAAILRAWDLRTQAVMDFLKAAQNQATREIIRPARDIHIEPTVDVLAEWERRILAAPRIGVDIETVRVKKLGCTLVSCIGFAISPTEAFVVPFLNKKREGAAYWQDPLHEVTAWNLIRRILDTTKPKILQNGSYDIQVLRRYAGISVAPPVYDTMLIHHSLYPEMPKSLGFLGSIYTDEPAWKLERQGKGRLTEGKRDDQ